MNRSIKWYVHVDAKMERKLHSMEEHHETDKELELIE